MREHAAMELAFDGRIIEGMYEETGYWKEMIQEEGGWAVDVVVWEG